VAGSRCERAVTYMLEMSGLAERCEVMPSSGSGAGYSEACAGGGRGNIS